ncbi:DNA protecting protein DprA [Pedobacter glucosidilyticus]|uniref:DNA-protecting protein DprA n=1 Tax=Pedobacter aquae TaxID=2605747 RepID=A0A5C0VD52_9SPHI|nr:MULTISPECIES: DNA-processing protein DprA [Pedobacter]KHJ38803.1 DNA protecting protein DprA [Pedobacter glucosidilyticus]QEK50655.1 DNA-protecting protein DprA [Pedobacter aquae]
MLYEIGLTLIKGIGDATIKTLLSYCGSPEEIFKTSKQHLEKIPGIGSKTADLIIHHTSFDRAEKELKFIEKYKIQPIFIQSADYPKRLKSCYDAPAMLYFKGNVKLNQQKVIAIVGTRNATAYGKQFCDKLISSLKHHQILIVSGLAYGIDIAAHKASLENETNTIGVLGHGLDRIYPALHRPIAEKMIHQGGLLTEFRSETNPDRPNFPKRNRIIAGMADATLVVEATKTGGALITAEIANSYNRDVFAVPGRVDDELSEGCNFLIKTNRAHLLDRVEDLEYIMGWDKDEVQPVKQLQILPHLNKDEEKIVAIIKDCNAIAIDDLQVKLDMPQSKLAMLLLNLEMQSVIISLPGKVYKMNH